MNELHPLGRLIQAAQDREGWSTRDLEKQAERNGHSMKHSNFSRLKIEPVVAIKASQIQVLASVLGVSEQAVAYAAVESMGVNLDAQATTLEDSLRYTTDLSTRDQRLVLSLVRAMRDEKSGTNGQQNQSQAMGASALLSLAPEGDSGSGQKIDSLTPEEIRLVTMRENRRLRREESNYIAGMTQGHAYVEFLREQGKSPQEIREALTAASESMGEELAELRAAGKAVEKEGTAGKPWFEKLRRNSSQGSIAELHGDEAKDIPVPPREKLAAHPKIKTRREQFDEESGERSQDNDGTEGK